MIRSWIKTGAAGVLSSTGLDRVVGSLTGPLVIGYHRVVEDFAASAEDSIPSMLVSRQMLEQHLDWLGRRFRFVSLDELGARLEDCAGSDDPIAAITFDDGYRDFYEQAFPLLQRKGVPSAVFVVTDLVGTTSVQAHDKLHLLLARRYLDCGSMQTEVGRLLHSLGISASGLVVNSPYEATRALIEALPQRRIRRVIAALESALSISDDTYKPFYSLTWEMIGSLRRAGVTIGSHTKTHIVMTNECEECVADEVTGSREELETRLGTDVRHFAYPSGMFDTASVNAVANAGYRFGYTVCGHQDTGHRWLTVPRTFLWENSSLDFRGAFSGSILSCQVHRAFDMVSGCRQSHQVSQEGAHVQR